MSQHIRDVLVVNRRRQELVTRMLVDPGLRVSLITEPDCLRDYTAVDVMESVTLVGDLQNLDEVRHATLKLMERYRFDAIVAPAESSIPTAGYLRSYFGMPGIPFDVAHAFCNKHAMKARLRRAGIPVARSTLAPTAESVGTFLSEHGTPAVIKPHWADGARNVHVVRSQSDIDEVSRPDGPLLSDDEAPFVIEDLVEIDEEYHCDGLVRGGEVRFTAVSKYTDPLLVSKGRVFGSYTLSSDSDEAGELAALHKDVVVAMGLSDSVTHLEVFRTRDGLVVGEIGCRPGGAGIPKNLLRAYGFDTWDHFRATELNEPLTWTPNAAEGTFGWVKFPARRGVVSRVPGPDVFADLPEVEGVDIKVRPGDSTVGAPGSPTIAGTAHFRVHSTDEIPGLVAELEKRFVVEYED